MRVMRSRRERQATSVACSNPQPISLDGPGRLGAFLPGRDGGICGAGWSQSRGGDAESWVRTDDRLQTRLSSVATTESKELTSSQTTRCTAGCTESELTTNVDPLAALVATLSDEQRRRLIDLLAGGQDERR
jgi:hypothetical protein